MWDGSLLVHSLWDHLLWDYTHGYFKNLLCTLEPLIHCYLLYHPGHLELIQLNHSPDYPMVLVVEGSSIFISCIFLLVFMFVKLCNILQPPYMGIKEKEGKIG